MRRAHLHVLAFDFNLPPNRHSSRPEVAERKSAISEEFVDVSQCVSPPLGYKYLRPRVNTFDPDLEPLDLQAGKAARSQVVPSEKKKTKEKRKTEVRCWPGEGNTVQYPVSTHRTEAPLCAAAHIKHSLGDVGHNLAPTSEAHALHVLGATS